MALDNLRGGTKRVVEENTPLNNLRGGTKRVVIVDGGGGGSVDYAKTVQRAETMPTADASNAGQQFLYSGESDATYTHGYIYENVATTTSSSASAEQTVGATLSDIAVDLATLESFTGWTTDNSLQIFYTADGWSVDTTSLGVTYTGTPNVGDAITITYTAESTSYAWTQIDVQPAGSSLPDQTGQSGKFLTTDGTDASWSDKPLVNSAASSSNLQIGSGYTGYSAGVVAIGSSLDVDSAGAVAIGRSTTVSGYGGGVSVGDNAASYSNASVALGGYSLAEGALAIAIGGRTATTPCKSMAAHAIQIGTTDSATTNSDANTFKVANANGNFEIMSADGTVPTDRFTTTPSADGTYVPTLTIASGVATRTWGSGGGGGSYTAGTGIDITNDVISVTAPTLVNQGTVATNLNILGDTGAAQIRTNATSIGYYAAAKNNYSISIGGESIADEDYAVALGAGAYSAGNHSVAIGAYAEVAYGAAHAIQIGATSNGSSATTNSDANTFKVANANGNFEIMDANGNLPADRLASTTGLADGNYRLRLVMASGVPTLEWVAE